MNLTGLPHGKNGTTHINDMIPSEGTPVNAVASAGTLTIAEPVTATNTMTIGTTVYTFMAVGTANEAGEIDLGANEAATKVEIVKAIKGTDGYNTAHPLVDCASAFSGDDLVITARVAGVAGDLIATTETFTHDDNIFDDVTLGTTVAGVDGTPGIANKCLMDASYLYYCVATNLISGANWVRTAVASY
jgi:hypothetical protein